MANEGRDSWAKLQSAAAALSLIAVPIVVAVVGGLFAGATKDAEIRLKTVEIAVRILESDPADDEDSPLRDWAIDVVDQYSGVPMPAAARAELQRFQLPPDEPPVRRDPLSVYDFQLRIGEEKVIPHDDGSLIVKLNALAAGRVDLTLNVTSNSESHESGIRLLRGNQQPIEHTDCGIRYLGAAAINGDSALLSVVCFRRKRALPVGAG